MNIITLLDIFSISSLMLISTSCVLILILFKYGKSKLHLVWGLFNGAILIWGGGLFLAGTIDDYQNALIYLRIGFAGAIFISIFFFHITTFFYSFRKEYLWLAYGQGLLFLMWDIIAGKYFLPSAYKLFDSFYYLRLTSVASLICAAIWILWIIMGFYGLFKAYFISSGFKKLQLLYLVVGMILGWSGGLLYVLPFFGIEIFPFGNFTIPLYCIIATYAILRYRLMDISLVFKKTAAYSFSVGVLTGLFVVLVLTVTNLFSNFAHVSSFAISIFSAVLIAILFNPLRNKIQNLIDKVFYKKSYDYYAIIQQVSSTLASMFELKKIFQFSGNVIYEAMGLKNVHLLAADSDGGYEVVYEISLKKDKDKKRDESFKEEKIRISEYSGLIRFLKSSDEILIKDELPGYERRFGTEAIEQIKKEFKVFQGEAVVPVFIDNNLSLLMVLGGKISGDTFTDEDINLLKTISQQTAIAVKTARLYSEKVRAERLASIGMMSASFAHEIKNPLTSIKTFAQLIPEKYTDVDFRENFSKIVINSVHRIDRLITDLLDYSSDRMFTGVSSLNITDVVDRTLNEVRTTIELEKKNICFEKNYEKVKINILGDEGKLRQALINIITNACQAIPNDRSGILKVGIYPNRNNVSISVTDNGDGISSENMPRMFEPFFSTKTIGVGLGLAITKKIIENHSGRIFVESKLKEGTTITLVLPMQDYGK